MSSMTSSRPSPEQDAADLPDGQIRSTGGGMPVQPPQKKYSVLLVGQIISTTSRHPLPTRGAFRERHKRRAGDAVDAVARWTSDAGWRTAKTCGPDAPTLASSFAE